MFAHVRIIPACFASRQLGVAGSLRVLAFCVAFCLVVPFTATVIPSSGCGKAPTLSPGNHSLTINGKDWWYVVKLPEDYKNDRPYRLIFTLHAAGTDASQVIAGTSGYLPWYGLPGLINDTSSAIFVSPNAPGRNWV